VKTEPMLAHTGATTDGKHLRGKSAESSAHGLCQDDITAINGETPHATIRSPSTPKTRDGLKNEARLQKRTTELEFLASLNGISKI